MSSASPQAPEAQITIRRTSPDDIQLRQIIVKVDGQPVAELMYGGTVTIPVTTGRHRLRVDNTWNWKTLDLDIAPGEHLKFLTVKSRRPLHLVPRRHPRRRSHVRLHPARRLTLLCSACRHDPC